MPGCHVQPEQMFNLIWGYNAPYLEFRNTTTGNGNTDVELSVVPPGELWVITHVTGWHSDTVARVLLLGAYTDATQQPFFGSRSLAQYVYLGSQVLWPLPAGYGVYARAEALASGKAVYCRAIGYKMVLVQ